MYSKASTLYSKEQSSLYAWCVILWYFYHPRGVSLVMLYRYNNSCLGHTIYSACEDTGHKAEAILPVNLSIILLSKSHNFFTYYTIRFYQLFSWFKIQSLIQVTIHSMMLTKWLITLVMRQKLFYGNTSCQYIQEMINCGFQFL